MFQVHLHVDVLPSDQKWQVVSFELSYFSARKAASHCAPVWAFVGVMASAVRPIQLATAAVAKAPRSNSHK